MTRRVVLTDPAQQDINDAAQWYERETRGLGGRFLDAVHTAIARIEGNPEQFPVVHRDKRRALLRHFPYGIYFRVDPTVVVVIACFHARRNPTAWKRRP